MTVVYSTFSVENTGSDLAKALEPKVIAAPAPRGRRGKVGVERTLEKVSEEANAYLFSAEAAYAAFGKLRRS